MDGAGLALGLKRWLLCWFNVAPVLDVGSWWFRVRLGLVQRRIGGTLAMLAMVGLRMSGWTGWLVVNGTDEDDFGLDEARENWPERMGSPGVVVLR